MVCFSRPSGFSNVKEPIKLYENLAVFDHYDQVSYTVYIF